MSIQMGKTVDDPTRMKFETQEFYIKDADEMAALFPEHPEALANTVKIAERCQVEFELESTICPNSMCRTATTSLEYLQKLCDEGLRKTLSERRRHRAQASAVRDRHDRQDGLCRLLPHRVRLYRLREKSGHSGRTRTRSAAGSIVSYCLAITDLDPIHYSLYFERFLNPERVSMPDIDVDFCYVRRPEVIEYVTRKYGKDRVAQIVTFGTMAARGAIRDVGRALNIPYNDVDAVAKQVPNELHITIDKALTINAELKKDVRRAAAGQRAY